MSTHSPGRHSALTDQDRTIVDLVDKFLGEGLEVYTWWIQANADNSYADRFALMHQHERPDFNFGFTDEIMVGGAPQPLVGTVQEIFYDRPKVPRGEDHGLEPRRAASEWMRIQVREYMLHYFMRVAGYRDPELVASNPDSSPPGLLDALSWCKGSKIERRGFGYSQYYYKLRESGEIGKFPDSVREAIVDVREIGARYEWVVLKVDIFNFELFVPPFTDGIQLCLPFKQDIYVIISPEFVVDEDKPEPGVLGRYGWGYALINLPPTGSILAYGPEDLGPGFMHFRFDVYEDGEVRMYNSFAVNQPTRIVNIPLNPVDWGVKLADLASFGLASRFLEPLQNAAHQLPLGRASGSPIFPFIRLANRASGGRAERELCISERQLLKELMAIHFMVLYNFALGTIQTWNQIPDWTDGEALSEWVVSGSTSRV